jgi:hypothetical protein
MNRTAFALGFLAAAAGLLAWGWTALARVDRELGSLDGFEGLHFDTIP